MRILMEFFWEIKEKNKVAATIFVSSLFFHFVNFVYEFASIEKVFRASKNSKKE